MFIFMWWSQVTSTASKCQYKYIKTIYLSFLLLLPQNYILKFSFMLCYQNCKVSNVSLSEFTELLFLFSGFHLIFPPLLLHFFFLVFLQYFPFLFPCSFLSLYSSALFFPTQNWLSFFCRTCSSSLSCSSWRLFSSHSFCFLFAIYIYFPLYFVPIAIVLSFPHPFS